MQRGPDIKDRTMVARDDHTETETDLCNDETLNSSVDVREACTILAAIEIGYIESEDELNDVSWGGMSTTGLAQVVISADKMKEIDDFARDIHTEVKPDDVIKIVRILNKISNDPGSARWNGNIMMELQHNAENSSKSSSSEISPT